MESNREILIEFGLGALRARRYEGRTADALAQGADEGRGKPRKSWGSRTRAWIPGCPNGGTQQARACYPLRWGATGGTETSKYPEEGKSNRDPPSSGERKGASPNRASCQGCGRCTPGVEGAPSRARRPGRESQRGMRAEDAWEGARQRVRAPYAKHAPSRSAARSTAGHEEPGGKQGGPPPKAKHSPATDSGPVP